MFYFLIAPALAYNWILILAAVIPAVILMIKVYRSDRLEKESPNLLWRMAMAGVIATALAIVGERIGMYLLNAFVSEDSSAYNVILYFIIVAFAEEGSKYFLLKRRSWNSSEFNCHYDAVVYAVFISLGFALWENISYVTHYGFSTALVRAVTAIPGHACFGVFMGAFYGLARSYACMGDREISGFFRILAVIVPALIHGAYDYIASSPSSNGEWNFVLFIAALFTVSFVLVNRMAKNDRYFQTSRRNYSLKR